MCSVVRNFPPTIETLTRIYTRRGSEQDFSESGGYTGCMTLAEKVLTGLMSQREEMDHGLASHPVD
jgi:hypothetical protein